MRGFFELVDPTTVRYLRAASFSLMLPSLRWYLTMLTQGRSAPSKHEDGDDGVEEHEDEDEDEEEDKEETDEDMEDEEEEEKVSLKL